MATGWRSRMRSTTSPPHDASTLASATQGRARRRRANRSFVDIEDLIADSQPGRGAYVVVARVGRADDLDLVDVEQRSTRDEPGADEHRGEDEHPEHPPTATALACT